MRARRTSVLLLVSGLAALVATGLSASSASAKPVKPVKGSVQQHYKAVAVSPIAFQPVKRKKTLYFTGVAQDQLNKVSGSPSATFSASKPTGSSITQTGEIGASATKPRDPLGIFWEGSYKGHIEGPVTVAWWWSTLDPAAAAANATTEIWADPGTPKQKLLASFYSDITTLGITPTELKQQVYVKGDVRTSLLVRVLPRYADASHGLLVSYGSASTPSAIQVPIGVVPPRKVPTTVPIKGGRPLVLSATQIGRKSSEPTIGVTKEGTAFMTAADFDGLSPATPRTKIYASYDGNKTWKDVSPLVGGQDFPPTTLDPYLWTDPDTSRTFSIDLTVACSVINYTDDQGKTWQQSSPLTCESPVDDHQTVVTGPAPQGQVAPVGYPNYVYYCVNKVADSACARSLDGGVTFAASGEPAFTGVDPATGGTQVCGGLHGHIVTDKAGRLYLPKGHCGKPWLAVSEDGGLTWRRTQVSAIGTAGIQTAVSVDAAGNVYYVWWDSTDRLPYMAVSKDAGRTFGKAWMIAPPGVKAVNFPSLATGTRGHVAVTFPGTTADASLGAVRPWNMYVLESVDANSKQPTFYSATANDPRDPIHRGVCLGRCAGMYDFLDVVIAPKNGAIWAAEVDTCTQACITTTTGSNGRATDAQGVAIRVLSGPGIKR